MAATITKGGTLKDSGSTKNDVYALVDNASITGIVNAEVDASANIADTKLKTITTAGTVNLSSLVIDGQTIGDILWSSDGVTFTRLPIGVAGERLRTGVDTETKLLVEFDGVDGSTSDYTAETGQTVSLEGTAQLDTTQKKFGTASLLLDGNSDYATLPDNDNWNFGAGDFTIDCWIKKAADGADMSVVGQANATADATSISFWIFIDSSNNIVGRIFTGATAKDTTSLATIMGTAWHHIAFVRYGNTTTLYVDGVSNGTCDVTGVTMNNSTNLLAIGRLGEDNNYYFNGWIDEFRISKGIARWTTNFTPPTIAYNDISWGA